MISAACPWPVLGDSINGLAVVVVSDAFQVIIVVDPDLLDVVGHGLADKGFWNFQQRGKVRRCGRMKSHENRHAIHRPSLQ
jgi:hypothetical protein